MHLIISVVYLHWLCAITEPELNKDYADWADHYGTAILPAKVRKPKFKSSVENAVGILEKGFFHKLEEHQYFSLEQFNKDLCYHYVSALV